MVSSFSFLSRRSGMVVGRVGSWTLVLGLTAFLVGAEPRAPEGPGGIHVLKDRVYREDAGRRLVLDLYRPDTPAPAGGWPAVVALHGGGWRGGSKGDFGREVAALARHGLVVVAVDYRLSRPGVPSWPGNLEDVREAIRWVRRHARLLHVDAGRIAALGASAGGHLAALAGTSTDDPEARVQAVIDLYGPADLLTLSGPAAAPGGPVELLLGGPAESCPERAAAASPARQVTPAAAPMLLIHGREDRLIPPDQSQRLAEALEHDGVPCCVRLLDGAGHGFGLHPGDTDLIPEMLAFLARTWKHTP